jgi:hypothetical protein
MVEVSFRAPDVFRPLTTGHIPESLSSPFFLSKRLVSWVIDQYDTVLFSRKRFQLY